MTASQNTTALKIAKPRDKAQDIAKGVSILLVILFHTFTMPVWFKTIFSIACVWLMPFFFTLSGYYYTPGKKTKKENIIHRTKQLMIPYFQYSVGIWIITTVYNLIRNTYTIGQSLYHYLTFLVSRNTLILLGLEPIKSDMTIVPNGIKFTTVVVPFWFIVMMMFSNIIFYLIADYALSNKKRLISILALLISTSYLINLGVEAIGFGLPWNIQNVPMGTALMLIGAQYGKTKILAKEAVSTKWTIINTLVAYAISAVIQLKYPGIGSWAGGTFRTYGAIEVFPCVLFGIMSPFMVISISRLLEKIPGLGFALSWVGARTIPFLFVHWLVSSFVSIFLKLQAQPLGAALESLLNCFITIAILVVYRIVWELILKTIKTKKAAKANA
ncbi:MAG: acyltransferase family protein [Clostridia bacterium]|nr:acyltransferase family protein [Clostridia bacterium]